MVQSVGAHFGAVGQKKRRAASSRNLGQDREKSHTRSRSLDAIDRLAAAAEAEAEAEAALQLTEVDENDEDDVVGPLRNSRSETAASASAASESSAASAPASTTTAGTAARKKKNSAAPARPGAGGGGVNGSVAFEESGETSVSTLHPQDRLSTEEGDSAAGGAVGEEDGEQGGGGGGGGGSGGGGGGGPAAAAVIAVRSAAEGTARRAFPGGDGNGINKPAWLSSTLRRIQRYRQIVGRIVNDDRVQLFVVILISINAIMMGIATFDFVTDNPKIDSAFEKTDQVFLIIFTIELAMQFIYHGFRLFLDGWLVFDFVIILLSWAFASAQIIRAFRIFRALRLITRVEVMRNLIVALFSVMPRMAAIGLLLFLIFYIFAVMFTQLFKEMYHLGETEFDYFSRMDSTFFTLFQIMTLDEWSAVARDVMDTYPWAWAPFVVFVIISGFVVVNLIIAVICDAIAALHEEDKAKLQGRAVQSEFETLSQIGDSPDGGGSPTGIDQSGRSRGRRRSSAAEIRASASAELTSADAKRQIEMLEGQVEELMRIQESSMKTLDALTRHVQISKVRDSMETSMSVVDLG